MGDHGAGIAQAIGKYTAWYTALMAAGAAIVVPAITVGNESIFLIGLGMILAGIGEFINHPYRVAILSSFGEPVLRVHGRSRKQRRTGLVLDLIGGCLAGCGLLRVILI